MIADAGIAVDMFGSVHRYRSTTQGYSNGELVEIMGPFTDVFCAVLPMDGQTLRNTPEGEYTAEDKILLTRSDVRLKNGDIVFENNAGYEIRSVTDLSAIVGIIKYYAKRVFVNTEEMVSPDLEDFSIGDVEDFQEVFEDGLIGG